MNSIVCPKCGHARTANTRAPVWQCPACGIAYEKYRAYLTRARTLVTPPRADDAAPPWSMDGSVWSLIAVNIFALATAWYEGWDTRSLMMAYWMQSIIIGVSYVMRIASLERFSTDNFKINNRAVEPTPAVKAQVASFFALHYGFFHVGYLVFLLADGRGSPVLDAGVWACAAAFGISHFWSYRYNRDVDRRGTPNIGTLMFTPYLRIIPMHVTLVLGALFIDTAAGMLLFGILKTVADVGMHIVEHAQLAKVRRA